MAHGGIELRAGTYAKVIATPGPPWGRSSDSFLVLYLRPGGRFLFLGYWPGYEGSAVAGRWSVTESVLALNGHGEVRSDALPNPPPGRFRRTFTCDVMDFTPILRAESELQGWSLLGWPGVFSYIGGDTIIDPDGKWLPRSMSDVEGWIERTIPTA